MNPTLYNTPFDEGSLLDWSATHQQDHFLIAYQIFQLFSGTEIVLLPIDPVPIQLDMLTWSSNHQTMHNEMDNVAGVQGFDLTAVNFGQRDQLLIWINLHAWEHYRVWNILDQTQPGQPAVYPSPEAGLFAETPQNLITGPSGPGIATPTTPATPAGASWASPVSRATAQRTRTQLSRMASPIQQMSKLPRPSFARLDPSHRHWQTTLNPASPRPQWQNPRKR